MVKHHVVIKYGPYESSYNLSHKTKRLEGLKCVLETDGHTVTFEESEEQNVVELIVHEEEIFKCKIQQLEFGGDGKLDPLCSEALEAVRKAY
eukprot:gene12144-13397_t